MIVTPSTSNGKPLKSSHGRINPIVDYVGLTIEKSASNIQKAKRRKWSFVVTILDFRKAISGKLLGYELVKREILVKRPNDPISICVSVRVIAVLFKNISFRIRVSSHI